MATEHNPSGRRPHYHRGRRGTDRRGNERRSQQQTSEQTPRSSGDQVDVDQIMREIRSRISQRHGIELTPQQIQDLAARRLEAILDPRTVNPTLFEQLRKGAATVPDPLPQTPEAESAITDDALDGGGSVLRFIRRLLNPLLKLLFDPAPLVAAAQAQARANREAAARAAEREKRQLEWNALHYQVLQRLVTEISRNSIETQALASRVEALAARVDFNDRRVRSLETMPAPAPSRSPRAQEVSHQAAAPAPVEPATVETSTSPAVPGVAGTTSEGQRRRRRRRRGRRGSTPAVEGVGGASAVVLPVPDDMADGEDGSDEEQDMEPASSSADDPVVVVEPAPVQEDAAVPEPMAALPEPEPEDSAPVSASAAADETPFTPVIESSEKGTTEPQEP